MRPWLSMIPVDGDSSARAQRRPASGSMARTSAASANRRSSTPLAAPLAAYDSSVGISSSVVATISLPVRRCATPRAAQYS
jgi:hypothetical protein